MQFETTFSSIRLPRLGPATARKLLGMAAMAVALWASSQIGLGTQPLINPGGWGQAQAFARAALSPELAPTFLQLVLAEAVTTLAYALWGTFLSLILGLLGGVLASEVWWQAVWPARARLAWGLVRAVLAWPRAMHEVIWGLLFVNILGLNPWVAVLSIAIPFGAMTAKVLAEILDETYRGAWHALLNGGASPLAALSYSLGPQALPSLLAYAFYRFECSIRSAAVLGMIGAGGLGYQLLLSFQSLRYAEMWTLIWALVVLSGGVDFWSGRVRRALGSIRLTETCAPNKTTPASFTHSQPAPRSYHPLTVSLWLGFALLPFAALYLGLDIGSLFTTRAFTHVARLGRALFPPTLEPALLRELWAQTVQTFALSILALTVAGSGGLVLAFPAAHNLMVGWIHGSQQPQWRRWLGWVGLACTRGLLLLLRAVPASVWALILMFVLFPGILPGALALGFYTLGILGRLMAEVVEDLDERPLRALSNLGAGGAQVFAYGVLPRALPSFVSYSLYRWEVCIRETLVVGVVGAAGLGRALNEHLSNFDYAALTTTVLAFLALTFLVDVLSSMARRILR